MRVRVLGGPVVPGCVQTTVLTYLVLLCFRNAMPLRPCALGTRGCDPPRPGRMEQGALCLRGARAERPGLSARGSGD